MWHRKKEPPLHPNVPVLAQIVELEVDCAKIITKFGLITTNRLAKKNKKNKKKTKKTTLFTRGENTQGNCCSQDLPVVLD